MKSAQLAGSPTLAVFTQKPSDVPHDKASNTDKQSADTTGLSSDRMQTPEPIEADTSDVSHHPSSSHLLPQPLQLLCSGESSMCTPTADTLPGNCVLVDITYGII